jgi:type IV secretory pathway VirB9-like protein
LPVFLYLRRRPKGRGTYPLELRAAEKTYMASVSWTYPQDQLIGRT